jgi:hypothetical protein
LSYARNQNDGSQCTQQDDLVGLVLGKLAENWAIPDGDVEDCKDCEDRYRNRDCDSLRTAAGQQNPD